MSLDFPLHRKRSSKKNSIQTRNDYGDIVRFSATAYSENALRIEHGLPLRIAYEPKSKNNIASVKWDVAMGIFTDFEFPKYPIS